MPAHLLLAHFAQDGLAAWENFKMWSRSPHADSYDIAWASAAAVIDAFPGQSLSRLLALLSAVETTDVSTATVILATPYIAKGLSWPWVALLDTYMTVYSLSFNTLNVFVQTAELDESCKTRCDRSSGIGFWHQTGS